MLEYCIQDVELTEKVYNALTAKMLKLGYSEFSCEIEHKIRSILDRQQRHGFWFAHLRGEDLRKFLRQRQADLAVEIRKLFPPLRTKVAEYPFRRTAAGIPFASYERHVQKYDDLTFTQKNGEEWYECYELQEFNLGSPKQRVDRLLALEWKPEKFTDKGFPKVDEDALVLFAAESGKPEVAALAEWLVLQGRASMLDTWFNNLGSDSRIHGRVLTCGASTRRMVHTNPNCVPLYSQALTRNGWKSCFDLKVGEDILAYDMATRTKKWTPLLNISAFPEAEIYSFGQKHAGKRFYCTKNHSWVVRDRDCKGYKNTEKLVEAQKLKHNRPVRINAPFENDVLESKYTLIQEKYEHDWVSEICKLSDPELHSMMQGFLLADGCRTGGKYWTFAQSEGPLLDAFLTCLYLISDTRISACQKRKLRGENQRMGYNVVQTSNTFMRTKDMSLRYEGIESVWCPTTRFGTWVMKQGDFITITGNTANIPSGAKAKYGKEVRSLWGVEPKSGLALVGVDAKSLETVGLCHYLNDPKATEVLVREKPNDIHTSNSRELSELISQEVSREWGAKTGFYAIIYGCYPKKMASILKCSLSLGKKAHKYIIQKVPGLQELIEDAQSEWDASSGRLRCIDGGFVICPSRSAALNYRIQSLGAVVMKLSAILLVEEARKANLKFNFVGNIHDEFQMEVPEDKATELGVLACECIAEAARRLAFRVPLGGDFKVGQSWHETH